ncbi:bifunctional folylpolyglutamate synthase/dihydrofolate synthase [Fictibacillus sp. KIGAM418]|uniref:tetrahydrofolate synthase n=1 Tax=Fictibacillus marinisediminis TaxID=2878389 RepID=A0A9X1XEA2_9BACL|nr:folylpolyglutamate synthase/dihydrofolate synthase family protein [Fictibacillus marinisediminis]MCK6257933.1 bifunctional folylpolyglutamate synthase/dihydrofolate synthase [Fictibacillus marinisediminis]
MFTSYEDINHELELTDAGEMKMGLERMKAILQKLGNPEKTLRCIHVAGTNGKGSTIQMIQAILREQGYSVGTFTSPFLVNVREHIQLDGKWITDKELERVIEKMKPFVRDVENEGLGSLSEFEAVTVAAYVFFSQRAPDLCLIESGLGGRNDSTNVIVPLFSIITSIGYDHMNLLGSSLSEITHHKAGIIKPSVPVITGTDQAEALSVIEKTAKDNHSKCYRLGKEMYTERIKVSEGKEIFSYRSPYSNRTLMEIAMPGKHQVSNAGLALMAMDLLKYEIGWVIDEESITNGMKKAKWAGRFEVVNDRPKIILDGAHNPEGILALKETLKSHFTGKAIHVLFAALRDKDTGSMLKPLEEISSSMMFTSFEHHRADSAQSLYEKSTMKKKQYDENFETALMNFLETGKEQDILLITGSLYFIGACKKFLKKIIGK